MSTTSTSVGLVLIGALLASCQVGSTEPSFRTSQDLYLMHDACVSVLNDQINWELYASLVYLNMAGYFDRPTVARPGFSKFFKDQSLEEYGHASKIIEYVNKRNATVKRISVDESPKSEWSTPKEALADAIKLEKHVYSKLQHIHDIADQKCQDNHLKDFLESYYFTEQVDSIRELQAMLTTLDIENPSTASLIEYMEDVKLRDSKSEL